MGEDDPRIRDFFGGAYEKRRFPNPLTLDRDRFLRRCFSSSYALREGDADYEAFRGGAGGAVRHFRLRRATDSAQRDCGLCGDPRRSPGMRHFQN